MPHFRVLDVDVPLVIQNAKERGALTDAFGKLVMHMRKRVVDSARRKVDSEEERTEMGAVFRRIYDAVAAMDPDARERALKLSERCADNMAKEFLMLLANRGHDLRISDNHAIRFRMNIEVVDVVTGDVVLSHPADDSPGYLPQLWGRWINRFTVKEEETGGAILAED